MNGRKARQRTADTSPSLATSTSSKHWNSQRVSGTASCSSLYLLQRGPRSKKASSSVSAGGSLISSLREIGPFTTSHLGHTFAGTDDGRCDRWARRNAERAANQNGGCRQKGDHRVVPVPGVAARPRDALARSVAKRIWISSKPTAGGISAPGQRTSIARYDRETFMTTPFRSPQRDETGFVM